MARKQREREREKAEEGRGGGPLFATPPTPPHPLFPRAAVRGEGRSNGKSDEGLILRRMNLQWPAGRRWNWELAHRGSAARYFARELYRSVGGGVLVASQDEVPSLGCQQSPVAVIVLRLYLRRRLNIDSVARCGQTFCIHVYHRCWR